MSLGIPGGTVYRRLPMVVVNATKSQIASIAALPAVRSVYADRLLSFFDADSRSLIGADEAAADPSLAGAAGAPLTGSGVTIAVLDSGVDATHPDLPYAGKVIENVRLNPALNAGPGFVNPVPAEGIRNTDLVLGHGTFVASVAAGSGVASGGLYAGVAPGASILGLSAGDFYIINVLEGFDYILDNAARFGIRIVNCSWGSEGFFDPDDPVNIATRQIHDAGITIVFAAGNNGPSPDTLNTYAVAPWVIGVGSTGRSGALSSFSSRGIFEELLYHPTLVAPGEGIIAASPVALNAVGGVEGVPDPSAGVTVPPAYASWYSVESGTSFAAPHVAGVVALMLQARPGLDPDAIKKILQETATPILTRDRSEAGAGRLDAWASLSEVFDPSRPFGTHIPGWLDQRPFRIDHHSPSITSATLPSGGSVTIPAHLAPALLSWSASVAWGTLPGVNDLDIRLLDPAGREIRRSASYDGGSLFGRAEGMSLQGPLPSGATLAVEFKGGIATGDQPFELSQESSSSIVTAYTDVPGLQTSDADLVALAVGRRVMIGRGTLFQPYDDLERGELARALALAAGAPQRVPASASFNDLTISDPLYPYVESVAGARARRVLIDPKNPSTFGPGSSITRLDFAIALVRGAGREAEAIARSGEILGLLDESKIPSADRGYVAVALEQGLIETIPVQGGAIFDPKGSISRIGASRYLLALLAVADGMPPKNCCTTSTTSSGDPRIGRPQITAN
jgi:serine protease AprX